MVKKIVQEGLEAVEKQLRDVVSSDVEVLQDAGLHIIKSGGKRLRPQLGILAYLAAGGQDVSRVIPMSAAIEMVHTATLVHDDINDHSMTRRGQITVHARWGRTFALLAGDYLFTKVYELMGPYPSEYNVIMATATTKLVEGETLQAAAAKAGNMDRETYKTIISRKTASLFEAVARMGAMLADANEEMVEALSTYAYNLGLTFQIVDDILDIIGDPETLGKPVGTDIAQNRGVMATQNGGIAVQEAVAEMDDDPVARMMANLRESGAVEIARMQAEETAVRARNALASLPLSPARTEMEALIEMVLDRQN
ncbi:MAG: polyprenyl synthetase family protein [Ardenticatenaceae bacterium]|nr:polyprenyl synthetase family protein [Ardenticatenaceae bacterium]